MTYQPGPARGASVNKDGEKWTLVLVRQLRHPPQKVWRAITDPAHLREWAPFDASAAMGAVGTVQLTWVGGPGTPQETVITRAEEPTLLEYGDLRWELEASGAGTRLTLWHRIDRRYVAMGATGWHICFDVLEQFLNEAPRGRIAGQDAMRLEGWKPLQAEYAAQFEREGNTES